MSTTWLPCGDYHQNYVQDHAWFQTKFIKGKMILLMANVLFVGHSPCLRILTCSVSGTWLAIQY